MLSCENHAADDAAVWGCCDCDDSCGGLFFVKTSKSEWLITDRDCWDWGMRPMVIEAWEGEM